MVDLVYDFYRFTFDFLSVRKLYVFLLRRGFVEESKTSERLTLLGKGKLVKESPRLFTVFFLH